MQLNLGLYDTTGDTVIKLFASKEDNNLVIKVLNRLTPKPHPRNREQVLG